MRSAYRGKLLTKKTFIISWAVAFLLLGFACDYSHAARFKQKTFHSPDEAFSTMIKAMRDNNGKEMSTLFGSHGNELFSSEDDMKGDTCTRFLKAYNEKHRIEIVGNRKAVLHVGKDDWAWPVPAVKAGGRWHMGTQAGRLEILARRIGRNEVAAVQVCMAYVDAQNEYAQDHPTAKGIGEYAQQFASNDGLQNGLCWKTRAGEKPSPMGPEIADACFVVGSSSNQLENKNPQPYHGYFYKILTKQGSHASGEAYDYIVDGRMLGGFALVAYPAVYGSTGIMTFIVSKDGVVYQKNLGKDTLKNAEAMASFDPDKSWTKVD